jgi:hypothetical protein
MEVLETFGPSEMTVTNNRKVRSDGANFIKGATPSFRRQVSCKMATAIDTILEHRMRNGNGAILLVSQLKVNLKYSGTSVHEQIFRTKTSLVTNGVLSNEHASRQQRLAKSWEHRWDSISCCVTFARYTSLLEFAVSSLEFHCVPNNNLLLLLLK